MDALPLLLAVALAAPLSPAELDRAAAAFASAHAGARLVRAATAGLEHASGLAVARLAPADEDNARAFLAQQGAAFGVDASADLRTVRIWSGANGGSAVFERTARGLPVFGGRVAVGWRADGAITVVNGARALAALPEGTFRADAEAARATALAAAPGLPGASSVSPGWLQFEGALRPVHRVEHDATGPLDSFVSYVDAESGALLYRVSRRRTAAALPGCAPCAAPPCVCAYRDSPLSPPPPGGSIADAPEPFAARDLVAPGDRLTGTRTAAYACAGRDPDPAACVDQLAVAAGGSFLAPPDPTLRDPRDAFAEQSAYFHIDDHSRFLDGLDGACLATPPTPGAAPRCFAERTPAGGVGFIPGYVNALSGGAPLDNAYFQPSGGPLGSSGVMIFGQGTLVDLAYDAEIIYHELTHAAVDATARFESITDRFGANTDPGALDEGTADVFAVAHVAEALAATGPIDPAACISRYFGAAVGVDCLRRADNARTCRGNGPNDGRDPGRDGEVHDDGEIWTGFAWSVLRTAHDHGLRPAVTAAFFRALETVGPHPTFEGYARSVRQAMADLGLPQEALDFTDCTIAQRDLAGCADRAVPLYSGERAAVGLFGLSSTGGLTTAGQQYFVDVPCGATALHLQTGDATGHGRLYVRYGAPVEFAAAGIGQPRYDWTVTQNQREVVLDATGCATCACSGARTPFGAGRWYLLPVGAPRDAGGNTNVFQLGVSIESPAGVAAPARVPYTMGAAGSADANVCTWGATGATPARPIPRIPVDPPALDGCAAPVTPPASTDLASCQTPAPAASPSSGCGQGPATPDAIALLALVAAVAVRRLGRRRAARSDGGHHA